MVLRTTQRGRAGGGEQGEGQCDTRPAFKVQVGRFWPWVGYWGLCGVVGFEGGRVGGGWCFPRRTTPADALSAKLQVELISREGGKGWGDLAQESGQGPRACPGRHCTLASYRGTLYRGGPPGPRRHPCSSALAVSRALRLLPGPQPREIIQCILLGRCQRL